MTIPAELPVPIARFLGDFVGRSRRLLMIRAAGVAVALFIGVALLCCGVDRFAHLPAFVRAVLLALDLAALLTLIIRAALRIRRQPDWVAVAMAAERVNPRFGQKLVTVTSQSLAAPSQRGSLQILDELVNDVTLGIRLKEPTQAPGVSRAVVPWIGILLFTMFAAVVLQIRSLHAGQLAGRFLQPFASIAPVTTTQISVSPGDVAVVQSQPLAIRADVVNLGDTPPSLQVQNGGTTWTSFPMTATGDRSFVATIGSVDRDQKYCIAGGDARTPEYQVKVLRRPAISRFDFLYEYPAYTRLRPGAFHNEDGRIEAPTGSRVTVTITSTEKLKEAVFIAGTDRLVMKIDGAGTSAQTQITATANLEYSIELVSDRAVAGGMSSPGTIRVLPDLPPQVRVLRGGDSLRQTARDQIPISYDALDDYGIVSLNLQADVNGATRDLLPMRWTGDARRQQDTYTFDLANYSLAYGDVLTLTMIATDTGSHVVRATPLQAMIMPRAIGMDAYQRTLELQHTTQILGDLSSQLDRAAVLNSAAATQPARQPGSGRFDREVTGAIQSEVMFKQALLRAIAHSDSAPFSTKLATWIDANEVAANSLQELFRRRGGAAPVTADGGSLRDTISSIGAVAGEVKTLLNFELATALKKDLENLAAAQQRPLEKDDSARTRAATTLQRMQEEIADQTRQLGLDRAAPDLTSRVNAIILQGEQLLLASRPVSLRAVTAAWVKTDRSDPLHRVGLEARLAAAAQAEAVRPDADLIRARDLELAGRAVVITRTNLAIDAAGIEAIAGAIRTLADRTTTLGGLHPTTLPATEQFALAAARTILRRAANEFDERAPDADVPIEGQRDLESLALAASAASASRQYQRASDIQSQLYRRIRGRYRRDRNSSAKSQPGDDGLGPLPDRIERRREAAERETEAAKRLDELDQRQQQLAQSSDLNPAELAQRQRGVADELSNFGSDSTNAASTPDGRERATAEVMGAIELLAAMPQALSDAQGAAQSRRAASNSARHATTAATRAAGADREVLERVAERANESVVDAKARLVKAAAPLLPLNIQLLAQRLGAYAPETDAARDLLQVRLEPMLAGLQDSLADDDTEDTDRAAADALDAISAAQRELAASRDLLMRRDPLAAARSFARLAADSLAASPPNISGAKRHQAGVFESISRAWDQSIHRAAQQRLASVPSMAAVLGSPMAGDTDAATRPADRFSNARQWDRMRSEDDAALDATLHNTEPAGYEQSLKLYFEALGRGQSQDARPGEEEHK